MNRIVLGFLLVTSLFVINGCATFTNYKASPQQVKASNDTFETTLSTNCGTGGCTSFELAIKNKTNKAIEIDWSKTKHIANGQTTGGLWYTGIVIRDRNNIRPPDLIMPNTTYSKTVTPSVSLELKSFPIAWQINPMPSGTNGIYLSVLSEGKEITETLVTEVSIVEEPYKEIAKEPSR